MKYPYHNRICINICINCQRPSQQQHILQAHPVRAIANKIKLMMITTFHTTEHCTIKKIPWLFKIPDTTLKKPNPPPEKESVPE
jgi:hypothetical protein